MLCARSLLKVIVVRRRYKIINVIAFIMDEGVL